jgi:hypothetical protein
MVCGQADTWMPLGRPLSSNRPETTHASQGHARVLPGPRMTVHRIRLRGPWLLEPAAAPDSPRTVRLPLPWCELVECGAGRLRLSRRFNRPTNLGLDDRVSVVVHELPSGALVCLNGTNLEEQAGQDSVFDAPHLEPSNLLTVEFDVSTRSAARGDAWGEVALLISSP